MRFLPPLDIVARVPLLPVMLWQGLRLRRTALVLPEAAGPRQGRQGKGAPLRVLIIGDSSAAGVGAERQSDALSGQLAQALGQSFDVDWTLIARTGATTRAVHAMALSAQAGRYDAAVIAVGVNDAVRLIPARRWRLRHRALRALLRDKFGVRLIVVTQVPPLGDFPALTPLLRWIIGCHAARLGAALRDDLAQERSSALLEFDMPLTPDAMARDGYHPNTATYALWARKAAERIVAGYDPVNR